MKTHQGHGFFLYAVVTITCLLGTGKKIFRFYGMFALLIITINFRGAGVGI